MAGISIRTCCKQNKTLLLHPESWIGILKRKRMSIRVRPQTFLLIRVHLAEKTLVSKLTSYSWRKRMINTDVGQTVQQWTRRRREKVSVFDDGTAAKLSAHLDLSKREKVFLFFLETVNTTCAFFDVFNSFEI